MQRHCADSARRAQSCGRGRGGAGSAWLDSTQPLGGGGADWAYHDGHALQLVLEMLRELRLVRLKAHKRRVTRDSKRIQRKLRNSATRKRGRRQRDTLATQTREGLSRLLGGLHWLRRPAVLAGSWGAPSPVCAGSWGEEG